MDKERRKKIQTTKLVITEIFMIVVVVLTVAILTFIVMGYHLNEDGEIEQFGLVQIDSVPTGATVTIDGETLPNETNTSKILPEGEHNIQLKKDGYTSWTKTVELHPGFLTKLSYPHLYKENPETEIIQKFEQMPSLFMASKNRSLGLLKYPGGKLEIFNLESKKAKKNQLDLLNIINGYTEEELDEAKVVDWSNSGERIILALKKDAYSRFYVIDLERPEYSLDLSAEFNLDISELHFLNDQGDRLGILENNNFRTISLADKKLSSVLVKDVLSFSNYNSKTVLVTKSLSDEKKILLYNTTNQSEIIIGESTAKDTQVFVSEYAGRATLVFIDDNHIKVYRGDWPAENITKENPLDGLVGKYNLNFDTPKEFTFKGEGQLAVASSDNNFAVFDLENYKLTTYSLESNLTFWPDEYTIGVVSDSKLILRDFDGTNAVTFKEVENGFPAVITKDNNYLYYINKEASLARDFIK